MAPHYQFFQRTMVHVNSQVLPSSTHPRPAASLHHHLDCERHLEISAANPRYVRGLAKGASKKSRRRRENRLDYSDETPAQRRAFGSIAGWRVPVLKDANSGNQGGSRKRWG